MNSCTRIPIKNVWWLLILLSARVYSQDNAAIRSIDSMVVAINKMPLSVKGGIQQIGSVKLGTQYYYDSTQNLLYKVQQYFGSETETTIIEFYYSGQILQKCLVTFRSNEMKEPEIGSIYYDGVKVIYEDLKRDVDIERNRMGGQRFVEEFQRL